MTEQGFETTEPAVETTAVETTEQEPAAGRGPRQVKIGRVINAKEQKTIVVRVETTHMHRLYHRPMKRSSKFVAHDEQNTSREGDLVAIVSSRPLSKRKRWRLREVLERAQD
jgi:small subunit ribosomal protein S17